MHDCIFCKIRDREVTSTIQYEDEHCLAFNDLYPKKRIHILLVPKKHIATIADLQEGDEKVIGHLVKVAKGIAEKEKLAGYQLQFNVGKEGGQVIFHVHLHLIAN